MTLREEWNEQIKDKNDIYIYGAGKVGKRLLKLLFESGIGEKCKGFLVTSLEDNEKQIMGKEVIKFTGDLNKDISIFVSVSKAYHPEVYKLLEENNFQNIIEAHKYYSLELDNKQIEYGEVNNREDLIHKYKKYSQAFGGKKFYQSLPKLDIIGERPTDERLIKYDIDKYINKESSILDIGSNCGFIDLTLAEKVNEIVGIEYNEKLVEIAKDTARLLNIDNVQFINADYNEWQKYNTKKFDIILAFAVHIWLNIETDEFANQIYKLLNDNGYFIFESQTYQSDILYDKFCEEFISIGLKEVNKEFMKDDGKTLRKFSIFKK